MKKSLFYILVTTSVISLLSCSKKEVTNIDETVSKEQVEVSANVVTIHAGFEDTKTSYEGEVTFSWTLGDKIGVWTTDGAGNYEKVIFEAQASGPSVDFTGTLSEGFTLVPDGKAFYPDGNAVDRNNFKSEFDGTDYTVTLGGTIDVDLSNPMAIIPLVGNNDGAGNYSFKTATGILKVSYESLQASTGYICVEKSANEFALNGTFSLENDEVKMENATATYSLKYLRISGTVEGCSGVFYFPIPTGSIPAGVQFKTINSAYTSYLTSSPATSMAIPITRNKITNISVTLDGGSAWEYLGKGLFKDDYSFALVGKVGHMVPVDILKSKTDSKLFAVVNPYGAAWDVFGETYSGSTDIMHLAVKKVGDVIATTTLSTTVTQDDLVFFYGNNATKTNLVNEAVKTGIDAEGKTYRIYHPIWVTDSEESMLNSKVVSYQDDGTTPAIITLAPKLVKYMTVYPLEEATDAVYVIFPGCNPAAAVEGTYNINSDANTYQIVISQSDDLSKGDVMVSGYPTWNLTGKLYGDYDYEQGTITINKNQTFDVYNSKYYFPYMGVIPSDGQDIVFDFDTSFLSETPDDAIKLYVGRLLITRENGFGIAYHDATPTGSVYATTHKWTTGKVRFYKVRN